MKILLTAVNAKYIHSNPAVYSLRAYAGEWQNNIEIAEYTINQLPEQILADLYERQPDVIAFSCYIWNISVIKELVRELKKVLPAAALWLGGPEVSFDAPEVLKDYPELAGIMCGEGEETFDDLCRYYVTGEGRLADIAGLCLPGTGYTAARALTDLNNIPFIYEDLSGFADRILYYETSRGCPYACSYCLSSIDKAVRFRSMDKISRELDFFLKNKVPQVKFIDRTFNCNHRHALAIWQYIKNHDNGITNFHFEIAADLLTDEEIELLTTLRPGQVQLEIGVQTANAITLNEVHRKTDIGRLKKTVAALYSCRNIHIHLDLIAGLPEEDMESFRKSFNEVYRMGCEDLQLGFLKVLKGSYMKEHAGEYGLQYLSVPPYEVLSGKWMSYKDILELKGVEQMLEIYHNSCQYTATIKQLEKDEESPYWLYFTLAAFYKEHGYEINQPSRTEKYRILLDFAVSRHPEKEELYRELITYDIYARAKCKGRPDFARDLAPYRELIRSLPAQKEEHVEVFFYRVWEDDPGEKADSPCFISFDYLHRDPVTRNAGVRSISFCPHM